MDLADAANLTSPAATRDPAGAFARLRERDPVWWSDRHRAWILTGHADVVDALTSPLLSAERIGPLDRRLGDARRDASVATRDHLRSWMLFNDGDVHRRLRAPVGRAFTPRRVERLRAFCTGLVDELLDPVAGGGDTVLDVHQQLFAPLPAVMIAELLGVERADAVQLQAWSDQLGLFVLGVAHPDQADAAGRATAELIAYFEGLVARRRREPAEDLISALVDAERRGELAAEEVVGAATLLLFAGHETTTNALGNALVALLEHPAELARLRDGSVEPVDAVEELLRFEPPAKVQVRYVLDEHSRGGHRLERGRAVFCAIAAANRDPAVFPDPDRLDLGRRPVGHVAFGHGAHFCVGAALARLEMAVALPRLVRRFPGLAPAWGAEGPGYQAAVVMKSLQHVPVTLGAPDATGATAAVAGVP